MNVAHNNLTHDHIVCQSHNLPADWHGRAGPYGIRIRLPREDPLTRLLGDDWESYRWYSTAAERDQALRDMTEEHLYSRRGDRPSIVCEPIERPANMREDANP